MLGAAPPAGGGAAPRCQLVELDLQACGVTHVGASVLAQALPQASSLARLNLRANGAMGDAGAAALADTLLLAPALQHLSLGFTGVASEGTSRLTSVLKSASCPLRSLDIAGVVLGRQGVALLADALRFNTSLRTLVLDPQPLDGAGHGGDVSQGGPSQHALPRDCGVMLANAIKCNTSLVELELGRGAVEDDVAAMIANTLHINRFIGSLNVADHGPAPAGNEGPAAGGGSTVTLAVTGAGAVEPAHEPGVLDGKDGKHEDSQDKDGSPGGRRGRWHPGPEDVTPGIGTHAPMANAAVGVHGEGGGGEAAHAKGEGSLSAGASGSVTVTGGKDASSGSSARLNLQGGVDAGQRDGAADGSRDGVSVASVMGGPATERANIPAHASVHENGPAQGQVGPSHPAQQPFHSTSQPPPNATGAAHQRNPPNSNVRDPPTASTASVVGSSGPPVGDAALTGHTTSAGWNNNPAGMQSASRNVHGGVVSGGSTSSSLLLPPHAHRHDPRLGSKAIPSQGSHLGRPGEAIQSLLSPSSAIWHNTTHHHHVAAPGGGGTLPQRCTWTRRSCRTSRRSWPARRAR
eukprot:jgi/Mesvir1/3872/Mv19829-RA.2